MSFYKNGIFLAKIVPLLCALLVNATYSENPIVDAAQLRDQQILTTFKGAPGLIAAVDKTSTSMGKKLLADLLVKPTDKIEQLKAFQAATKAVMHNAVLAQKLDGELARFAKHEAEIGHAETDPVAQKAVQELYFQNKYLQELNKYPAALCAGLVAHAVSIFEPFVEHVALHMGLGHIGCSHDHTPKKSHTHTHNGHTCTHDHGHNAKHGHDTHSSVITNVITGLKLANAVHFAMHAISLKDMVGDVVRKAELIEEMQKKLICHLSYKSFCR